MDFAPEKIHGLVMLKGAQLMAEQQNKCCYLTVCVICWWHKRRNANCPQCSQGCHQSKDVELGLEVEIDVHQTTSFIPRLSEESSFQKNTLILLFCGPLLSSLVKYLTTQFFWLLFLSESLSQVWGILILEARKMGNHLFSKRYI